MKLMQLPLGTRLEDWERMGWGLFLCWAHLNSCTHICCMPKNVPGLHKMKQDLERQDIFYLDNAKMLEWILDALLLKFSIQLMPPHCCSGLSPFIWHGHSLTNFPIIWHQSCLLVLWELMNGAAKNCGLSYLSPTILLKIPIILWGSLWFRSSRLWWHWVS